MQKAGNRLCSSPVYSLCLPTGHATGRHQCFGRARNLSCKYNYIDSPKTGGTYDTSIGQGISLTGTDPLLNYQGALGSTSIQFNRIEGAFADGSIRVKWATFDESDVVQITDNVIRSAIKGIRVFQVSSVGDPLVSYDPSFQFLRNDVHSTSEHVEISNIGNTANHLHYLDNNTYRTDDANSFVSNSTSYTFANWPAQAPSGDTYDPTSTAKLLGA